METIRSKVYTDEQINTFRTNVQGGNFLELVGLMTEIQDAFPASFKSALTAKGLTIEKLFVVVLDFTTITFSQGLEITSKLKTDIDQILTQNGIYDAVDKAVLSSYGLNWENLNTLIGQLTPAQKSDVEAIMEAFGQYVRAPQATPAAGTYWSPQNIIFQSPTVGASVYYAVYGEVLDASGNLSANALLYSNPVPIYTPGTTTISAVAVKGGVISAMGGYNYTLNLISAPQSSLEPASFNTPQTLTLTSTTPGTTIYYTTDGSDPATSGTKKTGPGTGIEITIS
ncbi:MAG: chitobiase/beta-hexosaminidase C-terminal domain-containing protein [Bacillota bacterium]